MLSSIVFVEHIKHRVVMHYIIVLSSSWDLLLWVLAFE